MNGLQQSIWNERRKYEGDVSQMKDGRGDTVEDKEIQYKRQATALHYITI